MSTCKCHLIELIDFFSFFLYKYISIALAEAKDIILYMNPLQKHFTQLEEIDFAECKPLLVPLMHTICLFWSNSRYYCHSSKITILLKQICNLLIQQVSIFFFFSINHIITCNSKKNLINYFLFYLNLKGKTFFRSIINFS